MLDLGGVVLIDVSEVIYVEKVVGNIAMKIVFKLGKEQFIEYDTDAELHTDFMMIKRAKEKFTEDQINKEIEGNNI